MASTYVLDVIERAAKTAAQSAVGVFIADVTVLNVDWQAAGAVVGTAALLSVLTSIASSGFGRNNGTASLVPNVVDAETRVDPPTAPPTIVP